MTAKVFCQKLQKEGDRLAFAPVPGELGQRILNHISVEAFEQWKKFQTMLINENRLNLLDKDAKQFLQSQMEAFFFADKAVVPPPGYVPPEAQ